MKYLSLVVFFLSVSSLLAQKNLEVAGFNTVNLFDAQSDSSVACYRIPALITAKNGDLIAAIDQRVPSCGDLKWSKDINIVIKRSLDNGKSWSHIETVVDLPFGESASDPSFILDETNGNLFMFFNYMDLVNNNGEYRLCYVKSVDNGSTWSEIVDITEQISKKEWKNDFKFITSGRGSQTLDGILLHTLVSLERGLFVFMSEDNGQSWSLADSALKNADESKVIETKDGKWMVNSRVRDLGFRMIHISDDKGISWNSKIDSTLIDPACNASLIRYSKSGTKLLLFSNTNSKDTRENLCIRWSEDEGQNWSEPFVIYEGASAYSSMTVLENGDIGILFEKDNYAEIVFTQIPIKAILGQN